MRTQQRRRTRTRWGGNAGTEHRETAQFLPLGKRCSCLRDAGERGREMAFTATASVREGFVEACVVAGDCAESKSEIGVRHSSWQGTTLDWRGRCCSTHTASQGKLEQAGDLTTGGPSYRRSSAEEELTLGVMEAARRYAGERCAAVR